MVRSDTVVVNAKMVAAQRAHDAGPLGLCFREWRALWMVEDGRGTRLASKHMLVAPRLMMDTSLHDNRTLLVMYRVFGSG